MHDPLLILVSVGISILLVVIIVFFILLIVVLLMARRTLVKVQKAVDDVEKTALRSLVPLLSVKNMFSDLEGFVASVRGWTGLLSHKRKSLDKSSRKNNDE